MDIVNDLQPEHLAYWQQRCPEAKRIVMNRPPDLDNCDDCGAIATHTDDGLVIRVAWTPSGDELRQLAAGGLIWLSSWGGLFPHNLQVQPPSTTAPLHHELVDWWAIAGEDILAALRRVSTGEDPDLVYAEMYANARHKPEGEG